MFAKYPLSFFIFFFKREIKLEDLDTGVEFSIFWGKKEETFGMERYMWLFSWKIICALQLEIDTYIF